MTLPAIGAPAPDFTVPDHDGNPFTLSSLVGDRAALLVFYPVAFSRICGGEMCAIRDELADFQNDAVQVLGVSCDSFFALKAWRAAEGFTFPFLSDFWPHGAVARQYGIFNEQYGEAERGSFLIDSSGVLRWSVVTAMDQARDIDAYRAAIAAL